MRLFRIFRTRRDIDVMHLEQMRRVIAASREVLRKNPVPDTFAGRKTQEPFPAQDDAEDRAIQWIASAELKPPK